MSYAAGPNDTALGGNAKVNADGSTAVGANTTHRSDKCCCGRRSASVTAASGTVAVVPGDCRHAVALGQGSVANVANTVSVGTATNQRQITNVAAGVQTTDAANVSVDRHWQPPRPMPMLATSGAAGQRLYRQQAGQCRRCRSGHAAQSGQRPVLRREPSHGPRR